ncbi:ATP-binding cassette domain-containing protein [Clostridiaceae bacterium M8S5]|nr:ATP-binding cassette domain-containing protein [Clostridiaceae bacterium M8S5]
MIEILGLTKTFKKKKALDNISVNFDKQLYGLLGANGSGKTTLMRSMVNLYAIKKGYIKYNGIDVNNDSRYLNNIGYLPQKFGLFKELTVYDNLRYFCALKKISKEKMDISIKESLQKVNLVEEINKKVSTLSGGMIRRLGIAQAVIGNPEIIILDEPTVGLDPEERIRFKKMLINLKQNKSIIISTHIVEDVEACCDKIAIMYNGKILKTGTSKEITDVARDKVYEAKQENIANGSYIEKTFLIDGQRYARVLSKVQHEGYRKVNPNVEDGYMCLVKGI